jgi:hypothetical protein
METSFFLAPQGTPSIGTSFEVIGEALHGRDLII